MKYIDFYKASIEDPKTFWETQSHAIDWYQNPENILSIDENEYPIWFEDGELNMCYLTLDKHIQDGYGDQVAIIYDSPVTQTVKKYTFNDVKTEVAKLAGGLLSLGMKKGETAVIASFLFFSKKYRFPFQICAIFLFYNKICWVLY